MVKIGQVVIYFSKQLILNSRYYSLGLAILASLSYINIPNFAILVCSLYLSSKRGLDRSHWIKYMTFSAFVFVMQIVVRTHIGNSEISFRGNNIEVLSILGLHNNEQSESNYLIIQFLSLFFASVNYYYIHQKMKMKKIITEETTEGNIEDNFYKTKIASVVKQCKIFYLRYMIWVFHFSLNLLLFSEPNKDLVNYIVFLGECVLILFHVYFWNNSHRSTLYTKLFRSWRFLNMLINFYLYWRYLLEFKYFALFSKLFTHVEPYFGGNRSF